MPRTDAELKDQSLHVFWHLRQVLHLSARLEDRRRAGTTVLVEPLDAAALEAFAVSARALADFFWRDREPISGPKLRMTDAFAVDWLSRDEWDPGDKPVELERINNRVGQDIAHISYRRLDRSEERGWQPVEVAHRLAYWFARFAEWVQREHPERVADDFQHEVSDAIVEWREQVATGGPIEHILHPPLPVATPAYPQDIRSLR